MYTTKREACEELHLVLNAARMWELDHECHNAEEIGSNRIVFFEGNDESTMDC